VALKHALWPPGGKTRIGVVGIKTAKINEARGMVLSCPSIQAIVAGGGYHWELFNLPVKIPHSMAVLIMTV
jgi:hypothetical protein